MTMPERVACMAIIGQMKDQKYQVEDYVDINDYFIGNIKGRDKYIKQKQAKLDKESKMRSLFNAEKEKMNRAIFEDKV